MGCVVCSVSFQAKDARYYKQAYRGFLSDGLHLPSEAGHLLTDLSSHKLSMMAKLRANSHRMLLPTRFVTISAKADVSTFVEGVAALSKGSSRLQYSGFHLQLPYARDIQTKQFFSITQAISPSHACRESQQQHYCSHVSCISNAAQQLRSRLNLPALVTSDFLPRYVKAQKAILAMAPVAPCNSCASDDAPKLSRKFEGYGHGNLAPDGFFNHVQAIPLLPDQFRFVKLVAEPTYAEGMHLTAAKDKKSFQ